MKVKHSNKPEGPLIVYSVGLNQSERWQRATRRNWCVHASLCCKNIEAPWYVLPLINIPGRKNEKQVLVVSLKKIMCFLIYIHNTHNTRLNAGGVR